MTAAAVRMGVALAFLLVALVLPLGGRAALAQYDAPAGGQIGGGETPAAEATAPAAETTAPAAGDGKDRGTGKDRELGSGARNPLPRGGGLRAYLWDGFLTDALGLFAVLSLVTTVLFFLERRLDRLGR